MVAKGQIIPVLPGGPLYQSIGAGEMAIRDILHRYCYYIEAKPNEKRWIVWPWRWQLTVNYLQYI